ncbi:MAG: hypothetical protein JW888_01865, partial [Pirellulales bacterium]|nr:hypothetical protein [Pirellulales bacterium]
AALLSGRRRVMTEVSDFSQTKSGGRPASVADMQATAAWQAAWGVTDFTLYYGMSDRSAGDYRAYCQFVGRLNAVLKSAQPTPDVLLYYPIHDLWGEYLPVAEKLGMESQSDRARTMVDSFRQIGQTLMSQQIPFALVDHEFLAAAEVRPDGGLAIGKGLFRALILPRDVELPKDALAKVEAFRRSGGQVLEDSSAVQPAALVSELHPTCRISPDSEEIVLGRFVRDGRPILLLVNVGTDRYVGHLTTGQEGTWQLMDPASGTIRPVATDAKARIPLDFSARQSVLVVGERQGG